MFFWSIWEAKTGGKVFPATGKCEKGGGDRGKCHEHVKGNKRTGRLDCRRSETWSKRPTVKRLGWILQKKIGNKDGKERLSAGVTWKKQWGGGHATNKKTGGRKSS